MAKLIHTMIRVSNLEQSLRFYQAAFQFQEKHRLEFPTFTLVYLGNPESEAEIELTWNNNQTEPYVHGNAYGHVAFSVDDLQASHQTMKEKGLSPGDIKQLEASGHKASFFFIEDPDGYKIEVLKRGGHYL